MAIVAWPSRLPLPTTANYQIKPGSAVRRTEMSSGAPKTRRVFREPLDVFTVTWDMSQLQFSMFEYFFNREIFEGQAWFTMIHYVGVGLVEGTFRFNNPDSPYSATNFGTHDFKVTATLERQTKVLLSEGQYILLRDGIGTSVLKNSDRLYNYVFTHLPSPSGEW